MLNRSAVVLAAVLCVVSTARLGAQQVSVPAAPAVTTAASAGVDSTTTEQAGPRLRPDWRRVESPMAERSSAAAMSSGGSHTVTVTTLVLVLVVIIVVLLVVK
jgi:hypothetical protein